MSLHRGFQYDSLYRVAIDDPAVAFLFNELGVVDRNFEEALRLARTDNERQLVREALIAAVTRVHPRGIAPATLQACGEFLSQFAGLGRGAARGSVFTTNYDLLLYRATVHGRERLRCYDAFDSDGSWNVLRRATSQMFYLHGAIHIFRRHIPPLQGSKRLGVDRYFKLASQPDEPLIPQVRRHLAAGDFPVFVSEGAPEQKMAAIGKHDYLRKVRRHFRQVLKQPGSTLFTLGHSLGRVDQHIANQIGFSGAQRVYVGVFSDADEERAAELARVWTTERRRSGLPELEVCAFDSRGCHIWSSPSESQLAA